MFKKRSLENANRKEIREYFVRYGDRITVGKESAMCSPKLTDSYVYYLDKGIASLTSLTDDGEEKVCLYFKQDRILGFAPILFRHFFGRTQGHLSCGIEPKTACVFYHMGENTFLRLMKEDSTFSEYVMKNVSFTYVELVHKYCKFQENGAGRRFCDFLLEFSVEDGGKRYLPRTFTYVEIAKYLGIHPVTVSKIAGALKRRGAISKTGKGIEIADAEDLLQAVEDELY